MLKELIAVDLDGTLIERSLLQLVMEEDIKLNGSFEALKAIIFYALQKTNEVTREYIIKNLPLIRINDISNTKLRVNQVIIKYLQRIQHDKNIVLATGSDQAIAEIMSDFFLKNFDIRFKDVIGSIEGNVCVSEEKLKELKKLSTSFTYIGNSYQDLRIWNEKEVKMICVGSEDFWNLASQMNQNKDSLFLPNIFVNPKEI